jgi:hypothetical protein
MAYVDSGRSATAALLCKPLLLHPCVLTQMLPVLAKCGVHCGCCDDRQLQAALNPIHSKIISIHYSGDLEVCALLASHGSEPDERGMDVRCNFMRIGRLLH